ncbi:hypothetical protein ES707_06067 [subsurface metagenome]
MNKRRGFSVIELMAAVFITALMALAGFAVFKNFRETTSVKVAARDVANIMRLARQKAITNRVEYYALYDTTNKTVWVQPKSSYPPKNPDPGTEHSLPDRVVIDVTSGGSDTHKHHTFTPKSTSTSGSVKLCDEEEKTKYSVRLESVTARTRIYDSWP